ncbi:MAG: 4-hydroxy-tetrahydrodipicolinate reductase [Atopococcus tabaci]|uniref:4-hydroxy-tetrahydrodipicolinate reductase n=1 Tax=Atopococcus tabaci TaxID=269774 RepID=A0AA43UCC1_9LACT|nr:4-hydroxy-tetrahydrodipicolinate reductase [Atopococcus tabaci]
MNILISGVTGAMGQVLDELISDSKHQVVAGFANQRVENLHYPVYTSLEDVEEEVDLVIDFSQPTSLQALLDYGKSNNIPLVIATTGYTDEEEGAIREASSEIPILFAKNMSLGINMTEKIVEQLAHALPQFDIEIIEKHHRYKKDSPSGTAKMLVEAAKTGRNDESPVLEGRSGLYDERLKNEIGVMAVRGGTIVGEHTVLFAGEDEVIEIKHSAQSKKVFANGALTAAEFLVNQSPGLYDMNDVLGGE